MKYVLLMRHAKSSWKETGLADFDRPLNKRGKRDAKRMGDFLRERGLIPDVVYASPAKRARRTAEAVAVACNCADRLHFVESLYSGGAGAWFECIAAAPEYCQRVMVIGHNPDMEEVLGAMVGAAKTVPTACIAHVELHVFDWREVVPEFTGTLLDIWRPRELEGGEEG